MRTGHGLHGLRRSNRHNFHFIMGGVYGDLVYHHGAGSRPDITFWGEPEGEATIQRNRRLWECATEMLFGDYDAYMGHLRGTRDLDPSCPLAHLPSDARREAVPAAEPPPRGLPRRGVCLGA